MELPGVSEALLLTLQSAADACDVQRFALVGGAGLGISLVIDPMQQGSRFVSIDAIDHSMSWCEHEA